jgi:hypothetical protein
MTPDDFIKKRLAAAVNARVDELHRKMEEIVTDDDPKRREHYALQLAEDLGLPFCRFCLAPPRYEVSWSDRVPVEACDEHLPDAKALAANDSAGDRTDDPTVIELHVGREPAEMPARGGQ